MLCVLSVAAGMGSPVKHFETYLGDIALYTSSLSLFFFNQ